jgi:two-component system response regulator YesN
VESVNILAVEDEAILLNELVYFLRAFEPLHTVFAAANGFEAYELAQKNSPDLLITDIRMPGMDGLELIHALKERFPDMVVVIISGHTDFEYARKGLQLGVKEYLLKPLMQTALMDIVDPILNDLATSHVQRNQDYEWKIIRSLYGQNSEGKALFGTYEAYVMIASVPGNLESKYVWEAEESRQLLTKLSTDTVIVYPDPHYECIIIPCLTTPDPLTVRLWAEKAHNMHNGSEFFVHTSFAIVNGTVLLHEAYQQALAALERNIRLDASTITESSMPAGKKDFINIWNNVRLLEIQLHARSFGIKEEITKILNELQKRQATIHELEHFLVDMATALSFKMTEGMRSKIVEPGELKTLLRRVTSYRELGDWLDTQINAFILRKETEQSLEPRELVQLLMHQVKHAYETPDSLQQFAKEHHISISYLSRLFKAEAGMTFIEYITGIRIEQAKQLLQLQRISPSEVALRVGYDDSKYFSQLFKKWTGAAPSEYQKKYREHNNFIDP